MPRRFLTAEDVRRAGAREIVVDPDTVVTPQALEEARGAGVAIRTEAGAWSEPTPDRGPDAQIAATSLPNLPEPAPGEGPTSVVVTAVGRNRPGVLAELTAAIGGFGGDVQDVSQKTVQDFFHVILVVDLPTGAAFNDLKSCLEGLGGADDYVVRVMHQRVFRFMHRI